MRNDNRLVKTGIVVLFLHCVWIFTLWGQFAGGEGTAANPWQIETAQHLNNVRNYLGGINEDKHFVLTADIDLGVVPWNQGQGWVPIGSSFAESFNGKFDGAGFLIKNMKISRYHYNQALFGFTVGAHIKNVGLVNVDVFGHTNVAGLAAYQETGTRIEGCFVTGNVLGGDLMGGYIGGLVGRMPGAGSVVSDCFSMANVKMNRSMMGEIQHPLVAGLVGYHGGGEIRRSYATGYVSYAGPSNRQGAVIGQSINEDALSNLYWNNETSGQEAGVGRSENFPGNSTLEMLQSDTYDGFDFEDVWGITDGFCYPWLRWQQTPGGYNIPPPRNLQALGGDRVVSLSWQPPVSTQEPAGYNIYRDNRLINDEPVLITQHQDSGLTNWINYSYTVTALFDEMESMPSEVVVGTPVPLVFAGGAGTEADPWQVANAEHLNNIRSFLGTEHNDKYYVQTANIDLGVPPFNQGEGWVPIGFDRTASFQGNYNGSAYVITGVTINRPTVNHQALFGYTENAVIRNVGLIDTKINGSYYVAGIVARIEEQTTVDACFVTGTIDGVDYVGGIVGYLNADFEAEEPLSHITNCYSNAIITAPRTSLLTPPYAGGIVGRLSPGGGDVIANYVVGPVFTFFHSDNVGAVIGRSYGGAGDITHNYWSTDTVTQRRGAGTGADDIRGNRIFEMLQQETFIGFNFDEVWNIDEGSSLPYLRWQGNIPGNHNLPPLLPPVNIEAAAGDGVVDLTWIAPDERMGIPAGYNIYRNGHRINAAPVAGLQFQDMQLPNWVRYTYYLTGVYEGEESLPSAHIRAVPVQFAGGRGTANDPYQVRSAEQLNGIRHRLRSHFIQVEDINLSEYQNWQSIGNRHDGAFSGYYDGEGFEITNLRMTSAGLYEGFFGYVINGTIQNVGLADVNLSGFSGQTGAFAGYVVNSRITNSYVTGRITTYANRSGGFIGVATTNSIVYNCWSDLVFDSTSRIGEVGGFIGVVMGGATIRNCYSKGSVNASSPEALHVGGFAGWMGNGFIINCFTRSSIRTPLEANIIGGFIGSSNSDGRIMYCYAANTMDVGTQNIGGFIAISHGTVSNSYWNTEISGIHISAAGGGRATRQMTYPYDQELTYIDWDFENVWRADVTGEINDGYPYLSTQSIVIDPNPTTASNPTPENEETNVPIHLEKLSWTYIEDILFTNPAGFRVYLNKTGEFGEDDDYAWVTYIPGQEEYAISELLPELLEYNTDYYWKVVPTTQEPDRVIVNGRRRLELLTSVRGHHNMRGDAENVPVWSFKTEIDTNAELPHPVIITGLQGNFPNPFNPDTNICYSIGEESMVNLVVYNVKGQVVKVLISGVQSEGEYQVRWDGKDETGIDTATGVYFLRLRTNKYEKTSRMLLVK